MVGDPGRRHARREQCVELVLVERGDQAVGAGLFADLRLGFQVGGVSEGPKGLSLLENLLVKDRHRLGGVRLVPGDQGLERALLCTGVLEVGVQAVLELVHQHLEFGVVPLVVIPDFDFHDFTASGLDLRHRGLHRRIHVRIPAHRLAQQAEALAFQRIGLEEGGVVGRDVAGGGVAGRIGFVNARHRAEQQRRVRDRARHRARGVLADRDRDDAVAADQAHGGFQADQSGDGSGADDAAVGFGADADRGEAGRDRSAGAGTGAAGIAVERVGVLRLPAARAPARARARGAEVRPLAEVGLAQDHRAGRAQARRHEGIALRPVVGERQRTGGVDHAGHVHVVLDQHRDAMQGAAQLAGLALGVERVGIRQRLRIELDHRIERWPGLVEFRDAVEVGLGQLMRGQLAGGHFRRGVGGGKFGHLKRGRAGGLRTGGGRGGARRRRGLAGRECGDDSEQQDGATQIDVKHGELPGKQEGPACAGPSSIGLPPAARNISRVRPSCARSRCGPSCAGGSRPA